MDCRGAGGGGQRITRTAFSWLRIWGIGQGLNLCRKRSALRHKAFATQEVGVNQGWAPAPSRVKSPADGWVRDRLPGPNGHPSAAYRSPRESHFSAIPRQISLRQGWRRRPRKDRAGQYAPEWLSIALTVLMAISRSEIIDQFST